jgi:hypothetical protein
MLKKLKTLVCILISLSLAACGSGGGGDGGGSTGGSTGGGSTGTGGGGVTTDNDTPPTNPQLDGDTVTITFDNGFVTPGGATQIVFVFNNSAPGDTTDTISGDPILAGFGSAFGPSGFSISEDPVGGTAPLYQYDIDTTWSDGLTATFTGTYDADTGVADPLVAVSGTITIVE